eukprot:11195072-Lingulodinium_polyedra.AAC.1
MEGETLAAARERLERQCVSGVDKTGARGRAPHDDQVLFLLSVVGVPDVDHGFVGAAEGKWL